MTKCSYFPRGYCFTHLPFIFTIQSLIILLHGTFCISLFGQSLQTLSNTQFHLKFSTDSESYFMEILKRKRWMNIVRYCFSFIKHQSPFFHLDKTATNTNNTSVFVRWSWWPLYEVFWQSPMLLQQSMNVDRSLFEVLEFLIAINHIKTSVNTLREKFCFFVRNTKAKYVQNKMPSVTYSQSWFTSNCKNLVRKGKKLYQKAKYRSVATKPRKACHHAYTEFI